MTASSRALLTAVLLLACAPDARADEPPGPPSEGQVEAGRALYREARDLERQGRLREALDKGLEAYRTAPTPVTGLLAGQLLVENGRLVEARDVVRSVGAMPASSRETDKGRDARQDAAVLASALDLRIPKIAVAGAPSGAQLLLDGRSVGSTDAGAWRGVDPGPHALLVRVDEKTCLSTRITLAEGEERTIDLHGASAACPSDSPAAVAGHVTGPSPPAAVDDADWGWRGRALAIGGVGIAALGIGTVLAVTAKHDYDSVAAECSPAGCDRNGYDVRNGARFRGDVATVVLGAGLAAVVAGTVLYIVDPGGSAHKVVAGADGVGLRF